MDSQERSAMNIIEKALAASEKPIALCSFGKDSTTVLHLVRQVHSKIPVMFFRIAKFPEKHAHAQKIMELWDLETYDSVPITTVDVWQDEFFEILHVYSFGEFPGSNKKGIMCLATGIQPRVNEERYLCAWDDLLCRPRGEMQWIWDATFHGQKSCDDLELCSSNNITSPMTQVGYTQLTMPIHDWSNDDVWAYIHKYNVPYDTKRYDDGVKDSSPDAYPTCYSCMDGNYINTPVWCPKMQDTIPSRAKTQEEVVRDRKVLLDGLSEYIDIDGPGRSTPNYEHV